MNQCVYLWRESKRNTPGEDIRPLQSKSIYNDSNTSCSSSSELILHIDDWIISLLSKENESSGSSRITHATTFPASRPQVKVQITIFVSPWKNMLRYLEENRCLVIAILNVSRRDTSFACTTFQCVSDSRPLSTWFSLEREAENHVRLPAYFNHRAPLGILAKNTLTTTTTTTDTYTHRPNFQFSVDYCTSIITSRLDAEI